MSLKDEFLLDPAVTFLNHGSFGACPREVFDVYQGWQREMECQPVEFFARRYDDLLDEARTILAAYVNCPSDSLVLVPNATVGINTIARSLKLTPDDEILTTNHEYGAIDYTWEFICQKTLAKVVRYEVPLPVPSKEEFVENFWSKVTSRTKVISISHITSPTALIFPIEEILKRAKGAGILTVVDGAHVPGQMPLDLETLGADVYTGNCHKWLCAPKGSAFLCVNSKLQDQVDPLVISWGWGQPKTFVGHNQWQGTRDVSAFLSIPAAIEFQKKHQWDGVRQVCHDLAVKTQKKISEFTGLEPIAPPHWFGQMVAISLPKCDVFELKEKLYQTYAIEIPAISWENREFLRMSIQGYNTEEDAEKFIQSLIKTLAV